MDELNGAESTVCDEKSSMAYNASSRKQSRAAVAKKIAYILNGVNKRKIPFNREDLKFVIGGAAFKEYYDFVSLGAYKILRTKAKQFCDERGVCFFGHIDGVTIEHPIPVAVAVDRLCELSKDGMGEAACEQFLEFFAKIALVSTDENKRLKDAKLTSSMPDGWRWCARNVYARYAAVNIKQKKFKADHSVSADVGRK